MTTITKREELAEKYEKVEGTINVPINYTLEDLEAALIGAWEGGSTYWVGKAVVTHPTVPEYKTAREMDWAKSEWAFNALVEGGSIYFESDDGEATDAEKGTLTLDGMKKGIEKFIQLRISQKNVNFLNHDGTLDMGQVDAGDADLIIQYGLWDEAVFG